MSTAPTPPQAPGSTETTAPAAAISSLLTREDEKNASEYIKLPEGKALGDPAGLDLAKARPVQWVVLAGPSDSGKTTLLASLYEMLQWGPISGYAFAGSNTLPAFEERCHLSRRESGNVVPHTKRTRYEGPNPFYLHLRLRAVAGLRSFRDILFTDVSGEMFEHARDSTDECKELHFLRRANHLVLFLDSERGIQEDPRWAVVDDGRALLRSLVDSGMIGPRCIVNIVWSRFDYFVAEKEDSQKAFRDEVEREFRNTFSDVIPRLMFSEVAARPLRKPSLGIGYGVSELLKQWAETPLDSKALDLFPVSYSGNRESELFAVRHFTSIRENAKSD